MRTIITFIMGIMIAITANAQTIKGPVFDFVETARVDADMVVPKDKVLKVVYDTYQGAESGKVNSTFTSAARFINMHVDAGHPQENIKVAIVVHGTTSIDVTKDEYYAEHHGGAKNANADVIAALVAEGVDIYICGQSAVFRGVTRENILPGVKFSLSAMTAHAMLQSEGYSIIPW
ncbi:DsrE family protein [Pseudemcibacter aquimaris]|uniref:DsrE family protein n=1 Tax=Pseudemcibacter aquimaris TaxID=2857064 RepID=UPI002011E235|nr:DsrE family protein [Pseudemcibacter aquimaris]MCC3859896.1 DsrE family protein [Pseudemcibacter aquimaris]WDU57228.1 DsrE family protein [Pseudemcibacter aquimaris]